MYISQDIAFRIKTMAKQRKRALGEVLSQCGLGKNTVSKISSGTDILTLNFAKIADQLECSIDYLLGRTDNPTSHITQAGSTVNNAPISGNFNSIGNSGSINVSTTEHTLDDNEKALLEYYNELSPLDKAQLLLDVAKKSQKEKDNN